MYACTYMYVLLELFAWKCRLVLIGNFCHKDLHRRRDSVKFKEMEKDPPRAYLIHPPALRLSEKRKRSRTTKQSIEVERQIQMMVPIRRGAILGSKIFHGEQIFDSRLFSKVNKLNSNAKTVVNPQAKSSLVSDLFSLSRMLLSSEKGCRHYCRHYPQVARGHWSIPGECNTDVYVKRGFYT